MFKFIFYIDLFILSISFTFAQTDTSSIFYYPLKSGNLWQYKEPPPPDGSYTIQTKVGNDTTFSNGSIFATLATGNYFYNGTFYNDTAFGLKYERQIDDKVYQYFPSQQKEYLVYNFSKNIGDTVAVYPSPKEQSDTNVITVLDKGVQNIFGQSRNYLTFYNRLKHFTEYWIDQITDSIGITFSQIEPGFQLYLAGAVVDNKKYGIITNVIEIKNEVPKTFKLFQNYPNPFNPNTTIKYSIPKDGRVTLKIYNILGAEVASIINEYKTMGIYEVKFNASSLPSGIYFYKLSIEQYTSIKKMIFLK